MTAPWFDRNWSNPDCLRCLDCTRCSSIRLVTVLHKEPFAPAFPGEVSGVHRSDPSLGGPRPQAPPDRLGIDPSPHDVEAQLSKIKAPTQITFGRHDMVTSIRFATRISSHLKDPEVVIFEGCAHAPIYETVDEFNQKTLAFLQKHTG